MNSNLLISLKNKFTPSWVRKRQIVENISVYVLELDFQYKRFWSHKLEVVNFSHNIQCFIKRQPVLLNFYNKTKNDKWLTKLINNFS